MSDQQYLDTANDSDLLTVNMIDSLIGRAKRILERNLKTPAVQAALARLADDPYIPDLLAQATVANPSAYDVQLKERNA